MKTTTLFSGFCLLLLFTANQSCADMLDSWHWRNPSPFANSLRCVCFGADKFVAVGDGGMIHTSPDGTTWDDGRRVVTSTLWKVVYANGQFIAVGNDGVIVTSADGFSWTNQVSGTSNALYAVAYGNGKYVACGQSGQLTVSSNGTTWLPGNAGTNTNDFSWIAFGNGTFVLPGNQPMTVLVSSDAQSWSSMTFPNAQRHVWPHRLYQAEYGNGVFVAAVVDEVWVPNEKNWDAGEHFYQSTDGTNWIQGTGYRAGAGIINWDTASRVCLL